MPEIAKLVVDAIHRAEQQMQHYELHAYVVMSNHVHMLVSPKVEVSKLTHSLKRFTAREANRILGLTGRPFWQEESYDRQVRDAAEFERIKRYIEYNPVVSGVVASPQDFPWSSGGRVTNPPQDTILPHPEPALATSRTS